VIGDTCGCEIVDNEFTVVYSSSFLNPASCNFQHQFEYEDMVGGEHQWNHSQNI
jgi:hypothetical protein